MSAPHPGPLPLSIITGFLGSGKTTLINQLLKSPWFADAAVLVNELGEIGIDHLLVRHARDEVVVLESGCICCTLRRDLVEQLGKLFTERAQERLPRFARVILETTGIADPGPIVQTVVKHPTLSALCYLDGIIATVDAEHFETSVTQHAECAAQLAAADRIVITKCDLVEASELAGLERSLGRLNPVAAITRAAQGAVDPRMLRDVGHLDTRRGIGRAAPETADADHRVQRMALTLETPVAFEAVSWWLAMLTQLHGARLLRLKGVISAAGEAVPLAVQAVHHVVYPPLSLPAMPGLNGRSHVVLLTRHMPEHERAEIRAGFAALG